MDRCPICRARLNGTSVCRRCRAELASAQAAEALARTLEDQAIYRIATGDHAGASRLLRRAHLLHASPLARQLSAGLERERRLRARCNEVSVHIPPWRPQDSGAGFRAATKTLASSR